VLVFCDESYGAATPAMSLSRHNNVAQNHVLCIHPFQGWLYMNNQIKAKALEH